MKQPVSPFGWGLLVIYCFVARVSHVCGDGSELNCNGGPIMTVNWNESYPINEPVFNCSMISGHKLVIANGNVDNIFLIDNSVDGIGVAYFQTTPSYENPNYQVFDITVQVVGFTDQVEIYIMNHDSDNNYPIFDETSVQVSVKENTWDDSIAVFSVTDKDASPQFGIQSVVYSFKPPTGDYSGTFTMNSTLVDTISYVQIGLLKQLDYETAVLYSVVIVAEDGGGLQPEATLIINVIDQEDTPPQFTKIAPYEEIPENTKISTSVLQVTAIDGDRGINHPIRYAIEAGNDGDDFRIDDVDGTVFVAHKLDADNKSRTSLYSLNISATKQNVSDPSSPYISFTTCVISVTDIDDHPPVFSSDEYYAQIDELSPVGTAVIFLNRKYITVSDADLGENAHFDVTLHDDYGIFIIDPGDGEQQETFAIIVQNPDNLNCDILQSVNMTVTATDVKVPTFTNAASVSIIVNDVNNHWPEFKQNYTVDINETTVAGIVIVTVVAIDKDINVNYNRVYYQIVNVGAPSFVIDRNSGAITVAAGVTLDRDVQSEYTLTVKADDGTIHEDATDDTCDVSIVLLDVNNKPPTFADDGKFVMQIEENTDNGGEPIIRLNATDPDLNHVLEYTIDYSASIAYDNNDKVISTVNLTIFKIDKDTGDVSLSQALDREITKTICLALVVTDIKTEVGVDHSIGTLTVNVQDVDDNSPIFSEVEYHGAIQENMENAQISLADDTGFLQIKATDADAVYNVVTLNIIANDQPNYTVTIDTATGHLTVGNVAFDYEQFHFVNLVVEASDNGVPPLTANVSVNISVIDQNDNSPQFENISYTFYLPENSLTFASDSSVKADDKDSGVFGVVTYLTRDPDFLYYLNISDTTGVVVVTKTVDYEVIQQIEGTIFGYDNYYSNDGSVKNDDKTEVIVKIIDENDNWPQFLNLGTEFETSEDATIHIPIGQILAIDHDLSPIYHTLKFKLIDDYLFSIDDTTGQLSVASSLIDLVGIHQVHVSVCDMGEPPNGPNCNETDHYSVNVKDINNHPPEIDFPRKNEATTVVEGYIEDEPVFYVNFTDNDTDVSNKQSDFNMTATCIKGATAGSETSLFSVVGDSFDHMFGEVHISGNLSRDNCFVYQLDLTAHNINNPAMQSDVRTCTVVVQSSHHHPPRFPPGTEFQVNFTEEQEPGSPVYLPLKPYSPDDAGTGNTTDVYCFILGGPAADYFEIIDHVFCNFTTKTVLDREAIPSSADMQVILLATEDDVQPARDDHYDSTNPSELLAHITCLDINDNAPQFNQTKFYGGVSSDTVMGTNFMNLTATDVDTVDEGELRYTIVGDPIFYDNGNPNGIKMNPFTLDPITGYISLAYKFSDDQRGYITFAVQVVDSNATHSAQAAVDVYVVSADEKLSCLAELSPDVFISDYSETFAEDFTNAINTRVVLDVVQVHVDASGAKLTTLSDVYIHLVNEDKNTVFDSTAASNIIDANNKNLMSSVYPKYHIITVNPPQTPGNNTDTKFFVLVAIAIVLAIGLTLTVSVCVYKGFRLHRQLKAATAIAFGSQQSGLNRVEVPNTNKHTIEGSNPVWNPSYDDDNDANYNEKMKENDDVISDTNSLQDIENENEFKGGENNPTFEERIENVFRNANQSNDDDVVDSDSLYSDVSSGEIDDPNVYNEINENFSYGPRIIEPQIHQEPHGQESEIHFV